MKKMFLALSVILLSFTACHDTSSFDLLATENNIGVELNYDAITFENSDIEAQWKQLLATRQDVLERTFMEEVNDELEEVWKRAYLITPTSPAGNDINYICTVELTKVTSHGVLDAIVYVRDKSGVEKRQINLHTLQEYDPTFVERVEDSIEGLGERLGKQIRYAK